MKLRDYRGRFPKSLDDIFAEGDELGLFDNFPLPKAKQAPQQDQAITRFLAVLDFCQCYGREPKSDSSDIAEKSLAHNLHAYRTKDRLRAKVLSHDTLGLLEKKQECPPNAREITTLEDIFEDDDDLDLLGGIDTSIFPTKNVKTHLPKYEKDLPDEIASRKSCEDFYRYEKFFQNIQKNLKSESILLERFARETLVSVGHVFILRGLLCFVDKIVKDNEPNSKRNNPRLRVVFANGTEIDLLKRSLSRALYKDPHSRRVNYDLNFFAPSAQISLKDTPTGSIYILASESTAPALASLKRVGKLIKIGYSTQDVHERIKHAHNDPTYLEAPVRLLAKIDCFNLNPQKFENLIHAFLYQQKLNMTLISITGKPYHPKEWFGIDVQTAVNVCERIIDGTIAQYRMDNTSGMMVRKEVG